MASSSSKLRIHYDISKVMKELSGAEGKYLAIAAVSIGAFLHYLVIWKFWQHFYPYNYLGEYALNNLGDSWILWPTIFLNDLFINALLILPGAYLVAQFCSPRWPKAPYLYGCIMYVVPVHFWATNYGFPVDLHISTLLAILTFLVLPIALTMYLQKAPPENSRDPKLHKP